MRKKMRYPLICTAFLMLSSILFLGMGSLFSNEGKEKAAPVQQIVLKDTTGFTTVISEVVELLTPAVVHINITGTVVQRAPQIPFFRDFFDMPQEREMPIRAMGSGLIIDENGHIITNNHIVQRADTIEVELHDRTTHAADIVGTDPSTDLAIIKIDPTGDMKFARFGDSERLRVGEWVVAIGSPRGLTWTVTAGIISAKNRSNIGVLGPSGYEDFLQTDAAINPGNSGGPLINLSGEVIGINSLIISASRGSEGLGFAIPSNMAKAISQSLIEHGKVIRGYLGVNIQNITPEMIGSLDLEKGFNGVIVTDVLDDTPADEAGLMQGDIITEFAGERVTSVTELRNRVADTEPGKRVTVTVLRDGAEKKLTVEVEELKSTEQLSRLEGEKSELLGLRVEKVTPEVARSLGLSRAAGLIIMDLEPGGTAARAGLTRGDIIYRVGNTPVNDPEDFKKRVRAASEKNDQVVLLVRDGSNGRTGYLTIPLS